MLRWEIDRSINQSINCARLITSISTYELTYQPIHPRTHISNRHELHPLTPPCHSLSLRISDINPLTTHPPSSRSVTRLSLSLPCHSHANPPHPTPHIISPPIQQQNLAHPPIYSGFQPSAASQQAPRDYIHEPKLCTLTPPPTPGRGKGVLPNEAVGRSLPSPAMPPAHPQKSG